MSKHGDMVKALIFVFRLIIRASWGEKMKLYEANRKQLNSVLCNYVSNRAEVHVVEKKTKKKLNIESLTTLHVMASASINCFITKQGTDHPFFPVIRST